MMSDDDQKYCLTVFVAILERLDYADFLKFSVGLVKNDMLVSDVPDQLKDFFDQVPHSERCGAVGGYLSLLRTAAEKVILNHSALPQENESE